MRTPVSLAATAALLVLTAAPAMAGGGHSPQFNHSGKGGSSADTRYSGRRDLPRSGNAASPQVTAPAGMPSFYQPSYSIDRKDWWQPHPYFQSSGQGFGYPARPIADRYTERRTEHGWWSNKR